MTQEALITGYIHGTLTNSEQQLLQQELATNADFKMAFEEAISVRKAIIATKKDRIREAFAIQEQRMKPTQRFGTLTYLIAACLVVSLGLLVFLNEPSPSHSELFAEHFEPYRNVIAPIERHSKDKTSAFYFYDTEDYVSALKGFQTAYQNSNESYYLFYQAMCEMELQQMDAAIKSLEAHQQLQDDFKENGQWYLALAYLKSNNTTKAQSLLKGIVKNKAYNYKKAKVLLKYLQ